MNRIDVGPTVIILSRVAMWGKLRRVKRYAIRSDDDKVELFTAGVSA